MKSLVYIGMDVHSKTFSLCAYNPKTRIYSHRVEIENNIKFVKKYAYNLLSETDELDTELIFGYEAGCLGFTLADDIKKMGFECRVMAPSIRHSLWKEMFWSQSYCLISTGGVTVDIIQQYIQSQGEKNHGK